MWDSRRQLRKAQSCLLSLLIGCLVNVGSALSDGASSAMSQLQGSLCLSLSILHNVAWHTGYECNRSIVNILHWAEV